MHLFCLLAIVLPVLWIFCFKPATVIYIVFRLLFTSFFKGEENNAVISLLLNNRHNGCYHCIEKLACIHKLLKNKSSHSKFLNITPTVKLSFLHQKI